MQTAPGVRALLPAAELPLHRALRAGCRSHIPSQAAAAAGGCTSLNNTHCTETHTKETIYLPMNSPIRSRHVPGSLRCQIERGARRRRRRVKKSRRPADRVLVCFPSALPLSEVPLHFHTKQSHGDHTRRKWRHDWQLVEKRRPHPPDTPIVSANRISGSPGRRTPPPHGDRPTGLREVAGMKSAFDKCPNKYEWKDDRDVLLQSYRLKHKGFIMMWWSETVMNEYRLVILHLNSYDPPHTITTIFLSQFYHLTHFNKALLVQNMTN